MFSRSLQSLLFDSTIGTTKNTKFFMCQHPFSTTYFLIRDSPLCYQASTMLSSNISCSIQQTSIKFASWVLGEKKFMSTWFGTALTGYG